MLPKSRRKEKEHRRSKRQREIGLIVASIAQRLDPKSHDRSILEFGTGDGFQIPYLKTLGSVVGSDVYTSEDLSKVEGFEFVETSITESPFDARQFDLIFSNHVIEHIDPLPKAFSELQRIGKDDCLYAFSVPTNIWLLISIPGQYYNFGREVMRRLSGYEIDSKKAHQQAQKERESGPKKRRSLFGKVAKALFPEGHGVEKHYLRCYQSFKIRSWQQLFQDNGFEILETKPLLLYGPSQWPIIPIMKNRGEICSSVLFLMSKRR